MPDPARRNVPPGETRLKIFATLRFFRRLAIGAGRLVGTPPLPVSLPGHDTGRFIASARRHCLLIVALGCLSAQLACLETERRHAYKTFAYLDKVLAVALAIGEHTQAPETSPVALSRVPVTPNWHALLESLAGTDRSWPVGLDDPQEKMRTYSDPGGLCMPQIYELGLPDDPPSKRPSIEVGDITNAAAATAYIGPPRRVYVVDVDTCVGSGFPVGYDYVVVERELGEYGIMLHQVIYDWLERGSYGRNGERLDLRRVHFLDYAPLAVPMGDDDGQPLLKAVDVTVLKRLVLNRATAMDGRMYSLPDLDAAIRVVLDGGRTDSAADLWGVRVTARTAVPVIPGVLLGLAVSLLYRVRRIGPSGHLLSEPWIAVRPRGVVEATAAITWAISLFAAALSVAWVGLVYQWQAGTGLDRTVEPWSLGPFAGTFLPLCLAANLVSVLVLGQACRHLLTLNRVTANPPSA